ncbi:hypothetical protein INR49_019662 [Caranx melampygus]|nr:hypothetical protein INR49_019662 [Caranx melampygus]
MKGAIVMPPQSTIPPAFKGQSNKIATVREAVNGPFVRSAGAHDEKRTRSTGPSIVHITKAIGREKIQRRREGGRAAGTNLHREFKVKRSDAQILPELPTTFHPVPDPPLNVPPSENKSSLQSLHDRR